MMTLPRSTVRRAVWMTLLSAMMFGIATPALKPFMSVLPPQLAAGVLYLGMGLALAGLFAARGRPPSGIDRRSLPWLAVSLVCGGVLAPWLLFWGLAHGSATATSLLANTEVIFSTLLARFLFGEHYGGRLFVGVALIVGGAVVLGGFTGEAIAASPALAVVVACAFWGIDNNAMRKVAHGEASFIGASKGLFAGLANISMSLASTPKPFPWLAAIGIAAIGAVCYGLSFSLYVRGLRVLGAARTSAYFGVAPFAGAVVALLALQEPLHGQLLLVGLLMGTGVWLHLADPHAPFGPHLVDNPDDPDQAVSVVPPVATDR